MERHRDAWWLRTVVIGELLASSAGFAACNDGSGDKDVKPDRSATPAATAAASADERAIEQVFLDAARRWNAKDLDGFLAHFTDDGLISSFGDGATTVQDARAALASFFGKQEIGPATFDHAEVAGDTASMDAYFPLGPLALHSKFGLKKVGDGWKLNSEQSNLPVNPPTGTAKIEVDLNEFSFAVDATAITRAKGPFALVAKNVGKQNHMLSLIRVPAGADVEQLIQSDSPSIDHIAGVSDLTPGSSGSIVFVRPLDPGRYVMVCFLPDTTEGPEGTPHAFKGMLREFTVD